MRLLVRWDQQSDSFITHSDVVIYNSDWDQYCWPALFFRGKTLEVYLSMSTFYLLNYTHTHTKMKTTFCLFVYLLTPNQYRRLVKKYKIWKKKNCEWEKCSSELKTVWPGEFVMLCVEILTFSRSKWSLVHILVTVISRRNHPTVDARTCLCLKLTRPNWLTFPVHLPLIKC